MKLVSLHPHPSGLSGEIEKYRIQAGGAVDKGTLVLRFMVEANEASFSKIQFPKIEVTPLRRDDLWKETCFEAFLCNEESKGYVEFNGSPNGNWNAYAFRDYREGMDLVPFLDLPTSQVLNKNETCIEMEWRLPLEIFKNKISTIGLTVVLKTTEGTIYWALKHVGERPDFHLRSSFIYDSIWN